MVAQTDFQKQTLFHISWPIFIELALHMGMGIIATLMLSHYSDSAASGVGVANQLISIFILIFNVTSIAATIIMGQNLGANQLNEAKQLAFSAIGLNFWFGIIISFIVVVFGGQLLRLFDIHGDVLHYGLTFIQISGASLFLESLSLALSSILRSFGYTKEPMIVTVLMNVVSIIGYSFTILGLFNFPVTGVIGVSWTIMAARAFAACALLYFVYTKLALRIQIHHIIKLKQEDILAILHIGIPSAGENISYQFSQLVITAIVATLGEASLAARIYITNISMFCYLFTLAIGEGTQMLVARYIGGRQYEKALKRGIRTLQIAMVASFITSFATALIGKPILHLFTSDSMILAIGLPVLWAVAFTEPGRAMNIVLMSSLKSSGDVRFPVVIGICAMWGIAVSLSYMLGVQFGLGLLGVWVAQGTDEWFRGCFALKRWMGKPWNKQVRVNTNSLKSSM